MSETLPPIPVDDSALRLILSALDYYITYPDDQDEPVGVGEYSLDQLLMFWSGYDASKLIPVENSGGIEMNEYDGPLYSERDLLRALIFEVQRLREQIAFQP